MLVNSCLEEDCPNCICIVVACSEDYNSAAFLPTQIEKEDLYIDLKSAAESGWDFSSRWFISNKTNQGEGK